MTSTDYIDIEAARLTETRPLLDVRGLQESARDWRSTAWWGNNFLLLIETAMFAILVASYLYYRNVDFAHWPPPQVNKFPPEYDPNPSLSGSTIELAIMLLSLVPAIIVDRACLRHDERTVKIGLIVVLALEVVSAGLRFHGFEELHMRYDDNAYGSVTWGILFLHLLHLLISIGETSLIVAWVLRHGLDSRHARDTRYSLIYWYWIVGIWVPLYALVYLSPRFL